LEELRQKLEDTRTDTFCRKKVREMEYPKINGSFVKYVLNLTFELACLIIVKKISTSVEIISLKSEY